MMLFSKRFPWLWLAIGACLVLLALLLPASRPTAAQTVPTFTVTDVVRNTSVTIKTTDFPANRTWTVTMGAMGTRGVGGTVVGTLDSGASGNLTATFNIPASLANSSQIAIRLESSPYYSYNWFYNYNTAPSTPAPTATPGPTVMPAPTVTPGPTATPAPTNTPAPPPPTPVPGYAGTPSFMVCSVVRNSSVTIKTTNFPPNLTFTVLMGGMGTRGVGGYDAGTFNSGAGGTFSQTLTIPAALVNAYQIAIRAQSGVYYAYNWFYNSTANVCP